MIENGHNVCAGCKYHGTCGDSERTAPCNGYEKEARKAAKTKFPLGMIVATRGVADAISKDAKFGDEIQTALGRYIRGDWGDLSEDDKAMNEEAVKNGDDRIFAAYELSKKIYIITEYDRTVTTILFPEEY